MIEPVQEPEPGVLTLRGAQHEVDELPMPRMGYSISHKHDLLLRFARSRVQLLGDSVEEKHLIAILEIPLMEAVNQGGELLHRTRDRLRAHLCAQQKLQHLPRASRAASGEKDLPQHLIHQLPEPPVAIEHREPQRRRSCLRNAQLVRPLRRYQRPRPITGTVVQSLQGPLVQVRSQLPARLHSQHPIQKLRRIALDPLLHIAFKVLVDFLKRFCYSLPREVQFSHGCTLLSGLIARLESTPYLFLPH